MTILRYILVALEVVLLFNLLIGVHELGHFLAAQLARTEGGALRHLVRQADLEKENRRRGIRAGLDSRRRLCLAAADGHDGSHRGQARCEQPAEPLPNVSPLDKIIVAFAGPLFSFLLAFVFAVIVWQVGKPSNEADNSTTVGWVDPAGPACEGRPACRATRFWKWTANPVHHFAPTSSDSVTWRIVTSTGTNIAIKYLRDGKEDDGLRRAIPSRDEMV